LLAHIAPAFRWNDARDFSIRVELGHVRGRGLLAAQMGQVDLLEKADRASKIDPVVALTMAVDRHAHQPEPVQVVGWL
jgi:hypothetical protein